MPREVEALRTSLDSRLSALEKALADPEAARLARIDHSRSGAHRHRRSARDGTHAVLDVQKAGQEAVAAARTEATAALEAEKVETAALGRSSKARRSALKQAEAMLKEQRRAADAASQEAVSARRELETIRERLEQEQSAGADRRGELEAALANLEAERKRASTLANQVTQSRAQEDSEKIRACDRSGAAACGARNERAAAAELLQADRHLEGELDAARREVETARGDRDGIQRELDVVRRELDSVRQDSDARTQVLSQSQAAQEQALKTAHDAARNAEARLEEVIRERDAALSERVELQRQLESAEAAIRRPPRSTASCRPPTKPAMRPRHRGGARTGEGAESELDVETVVDLTSITRDEERQLVLEQRTRVLEQALREAEARAESAELELEQHRLSLTPSLVTSARIRARCGAADADSARTVGAVSRPGARRQASGVQSGDLAAGGRQSWKAGRSVVDRGAGVDAVGDQPEPSGHGHAADQRWRARVQGQSGVVASRTARRAAVYRAGVQFTNVDQRALETFFSAHQS